MSGLVINREQLRKFLPDQQSVAVFESLIRKVNELDTENNNELFNGKPFRKLVTLTAAAAGTPVTILSTNEILRVGKDTTRRAMVYAFFLEVNGATAWTDATGTGVSIRYTFTLLPSVSLITFPKASLVGNVVLTMGSAGVTLTDRLVDGYLPFWGLDIVADSNFDTGSDIKVSVLGFVV